MEKDIIMSLVWVSIHWESKFEKQDLQAGEMWCQNSSSTKNETKRKSRYESRKMVLNQKSGPRLDWRIVETF